jgi:pheromone shutdown protein TraB
MTVLNNPNVVHNLSCDDKQIILLGTAHVSKESVNLVKSVIEQENPDTVAVELCPSRFQTIKQKDQWQDALIRIEQVAEYDHLATVAGGVDPQVGLAVGKFALV